MAIDLDYIEHRVGAARTIDPTTVLTVVDECRNLREALAEANATVDQLRAENVDLHKRLRAAEERAA